MTKQKEELKMSKKVPAKKVKKEKKLTLQDLKKIKGGKSQMPQRQKEGFDGNNGPNRSTGA